ncbi:MAG: hypothetical protein AB7G93_01370 [Bdellovibrionales bacterium]
MLRRTLRTQSLHRLTIGSIALIVALTLTGALVLRLTREKDPAPQRDPNSADREILNAAAIAFPEERAVAAVPHKIPAEIERHRGQKSDPDSRTETERPLSSQFQSYLQIRRKALRSDFEKREMVKQRRSRTLIAEALDLLKDTQAPQGGRLDSILLIQDALSDLEHPDSILLAEEVERILLKDDLDASLSPARRKELAADKGELALSYIGRYPARTSHLLEATRGTLNARVLQNALSLAERRRQESLAIIQELERAESGASN